MQYTQAEKILLENVNKIGREMKVMRMMEECAKQMEKEFGLN